MKKIIYLLLTSALLYACGSQKKLKTLQREQLRADVSIAQDNRMLEKIDASDTARAVPQDNDENLAIEIRNLKGDRIIMNAVKDEETGEMVPTEQLQAIVVEAKFRNLAERHGEVDIAFDIIVPPAMQDPEWQIRFKPQFYILGDTLNLEEVHITGNKYRASQLRGYELYNKFLSSIIPDTCDFIRTYTYQHLLEIFIDRNFKELSKLRRDSSIVDTTYAAGLFGVTEREAIDHYTKSFLVKRNNRRKLKKDRMYAKYVKVPLLKEGVRLDSVINNTDGTITYNYIQTIKTRKNLRKVEMALSGNIYKEGKSIYTMPVTDPLTFYISSMSAFTDPTPRYIKKIIYRNAEANTAAYIDFEVGKYNVDDTLSNNHEEIGRIKGNIRTMLSNPEYVIDSLIITASCSPEGSYKANTILAQNRANAIKDYFTLFISRYRDSVRTSVWDIDLTGDPVKPEKIEEEVPVIDLIKTRSIPENWERLKKLLQIDTNIHSHDEINKCLEIADADAREKALYSTKDYKYIRSVIYPYLRTVKFDFFLHRKGMIKDTVQTTEIDSVYMNGLQALEDRDYETAVTLLRPYMDYNSAVAFVCMDYNRSALSVLETLKRSAKRDYMLAVVYSRLGDDRKAVEYFMQSVEQDYSMRHRGNLDPEISNLIKKYAMNDMLDNL